MNAQAGSERFTTHEHRGAYLISYLMIAVYALRRLARLGETSSIISAAILVGIFTILYASEARISRRYPKYPRIYFAVQLVIAQLLGLFAEYLDTWAILYAALSFQVVYRCTRKQALVLCGLFAADILITLCLQFGLLSGLGRGMAYIVIGFFIISYDIQYAQREDAHAESQVLLAELQAAHQKLEEHAAQAEKLAAAQERERIIQELHDSVGQKIFAIQLMTESTRVLLEKEPQRAAGQIDLLQEQTQAALEQMRQLIGQWRPH